MVRLTLLLLMGIGTTMAIAGRDLPQTEGNGVEVARMDTGDTGLLQAAPQQAHRLSLDDEAGAIELALAASMTRQSQSAAPATVTRAVAPAPAAEPSQPLWTVTADAVNLRAGPSTANPVVGQANSGARAQVLEQTDNGWYRIRLSESNLDAYIYGRFLDSSS
ncbi:SH3 domain-containing protein [Profundibacterium mesophilum]|uniref:2'3'-cyclic-nucleotide 2'-phosphodiesterase n=1 Tax=Profundibacterium mesophilum KAUST100406-0324 TaxID=1037889 RepID=A0A921NUN0_9RHOB|nr:SH3 domain-containing protein [Profundibacterium mesophilum]KAF0675566.1 2'3'-cyclic-nucleotide 2'-phosphodiesterase [Profundibacterium mesophilum KAUST100406-0324]